MMKTMLTILAASAAFAQDPGHQHDVEKHGDQVMGFSHEKTTHHFFLYRDGGAIEVSANDAKDKESRDQIQMHLGHIAGMFAEGNFNAPMLVHDRVASGTEKMTALKSQIQYKYEKTPRGGRVRIKTANPDALAAVHEFLRFQITDHQTGDSLEVRQ
jgi:hypothetical protein